MKWNEIVFVMQLKIIIFISYFAKRNLEYKPTVHTFGLFCDLTQSVLHKLSTHNDVSVMQITYILITSLIHCNLIFYACDMPFRKNFIHVVVFFT